MRGNFLHYHYQRYINFYTIPTNGVFPNPSGCAILALQINRGVRNMTINLANNIKRLRKERKMTQEQLAEALGITPGAVYKWESGRAAPELGLLVELAEFFETSVDALLDYGWEKLSMGKAAEKLAQFSVDKELDEGIQFAEKALQKYPNSFDVVFRSAQLYYLKMDAQHAPRAITLFQQALSLMDQNTNEQIGNLTIQNRIAMCYCYMGQDDKAVELLKKNNVDGINNYQIGLLLSKDKEKADEALKYLSEALLYCYNVLYNLCIGYANAYSYQGKVEEVTEFTLWLYHLGKGLRDSSAVNWMDRGDVGLFIVLADMDALRGNSQGAYEWLVKARDAAQRFDACPEYRSNVGMKFYHGSERATSYDDMGETAMSIIENHLADEEIGGHLRPIWQKIQSEG